MWSFVLKVLRTPNLFERPLLLVVKNGALGVDVGEDVKLLATLLFPGTKMRLRKSPRVRIVFTGTSSLDSEPSVNKNHLCITTVHGNMPIRCCPSLDACRNHVSESGEVFEYLGGAEFSAGGRQWTSTGVR